MAVAILPEPAHCEVAAWNYCPHIWPPPSDRVRAEILPAPPVLVIWGFIR
jgi:hypothetical protein